jgi:hypothetical protein
MSSLVRRRRERRQIASRRPFGDLPIRIKGRSVTLTVERSVWLGRQLTFPMRAERGKRKKFFAFADDKESLVPEACVDAVAGVTARRTGVTTRSVEAVLATVSRPASAVAAKIRNSRRRMSLLIRSPP